MTTLGSPKPPTAAEIRSVMAFLRLELARAEARERPRDPDDAGVDLGPPIDEDDELLTVTEIAELLRMSKRWVRRNIGRLPFARRISSREIRVSRKGLELWLETRR